MLRSAGCLLLGPARQRSAASAALLRHREAARVERHDFDEALKEYNKDTQIVDLDGGVLQLSPTRSVAALTLFNSARVARASHTARQAFGTCVVGGSSTIKRIWHQYGVRPTCVFVPADEEIPDWCYHEKLPSLIVRTDPSRVKTDLLSADFSDAYGAEFSLPVLPSLLDLVDPRREQAAATGEATPIATPTTLSRVLALHKTRNPSNVGAMLKAASDLGFDAVIADRTTDMFNEKVLRSSEGAIFNPALKVFDMSSRDNVDPTNVLQQAAVAHRLLPLFAVPDPSVEPVFSVAQKFHFLNRGKAVDDPSRLGAMVVVGSEAQGLMELQQEWTLPAKPVGIALDNATVQSINVAFAASIMMHHFRPAAAKDFEAMFVRGLIPKRLEGEEDELLQIQSGLTK